MNESAKRRLVDGRGELRRRIRRVDANERRAERTAPRGYRRARRTDRQALVQENGASAIDVAAERGRTRMQRRRDLGALRDLRERLRGRRADAGGICIGAGEQVRETAVRRRHIELRLAGERVELEELDRAAGC